MIYNIIHNPRKLALVLLGLCRGVHPQRPRRRLPLLFTVTLKLGLESLKVIETGTIR